jgi:hypothetical protein
MARVPQKQPELLAREEIEPLFSNCSHPVYRMALQTGYAAGLAGFTQRSTPQRRLRPM